MCILDYKVNTYNYIYNLLPGHIHPRLCCFALQCNAIFTSLSFFYKKDVKGHFHSFSTFVEM